MSGGLPRVPARQRAVRPSYYVPEGVGFDGILGSQGDAAEDDEDEDEVGEVGVMDEVVAGDAQTEKKNRFRWDAGVLKLKGKQQGGRVGAFGRLKYQFFFPRMKKELPSGIGTIFSLGPENSGFNGATPARKKEEGREGWLTFTGSSSCGASDSPSSPSMALSSSFSCQSSSSF